MLPQFNQPQFKQVDMCIGAPLPKGYGYMYEKHPFKSERWLYGHPGLNSSKSLFKFVLGYGGSALIIDPEDKLVIAYVTNGLKLGGGELCRTYRKLRDAALECVQQLNQSKDV